MELKINIDGLERSVSGVTENTTCSQIIYALAHATSQRGRFVMIEKYRNVERRLAPNDRPLETLRKWREHSANVTFQMLRVDQNDEICQQVEEPLEPPKPSFHSAKQSSASSMTTSLPGRSASGQQLENGQRSTSSLPTFALAGATLGRNRRPPPPDYTAFMERKNIMMSATVVNREKESLDDFQRTDIKTLSETMTPQEIVEYQGHEEELRQLLKQQKNLRAILKPMIAANWPQQYQLELKRSHKLKASLAATKEAIHKTKDDLKRVEATEKDLLMKIAMLKKDENGDENSEVLETSLDLGCPSTRCTTPQALTA
uniref:Ras association domain-containing protein n=1 Tax=Caenorhabditis japonica TaxID=281687 RepID=A0A8R1DN20_CAEJA